MCIVNSGVLQGCPLAAMLFVLGIDPFLCKMYDIVIHQGLGIVRACADDIAVVLKNLASLAVVASIFQAAEVCAGPVLKPRKCFMLPLAGPLTEALRLALPNYLTQHVPSWMDFQISDSAEYLGIWFGPGANSKNWTPQGWEFLERVSAIAQAGPATKLAVQTYNNKAITVFSYPAQFLPPPPHIKKM